MFRRAIFIKTSESNYKQIMVKEDNKMENEIIMKWRRNGKISEKKIERKKFMATFEGLIKGFSPNNMVSKQLAEIIPVAKEIKINWDSTAEINRLYYMLEDKVGSIPIINAHSVVWAVLDAYCKEGEIIPDDDF